MVSYSIKKMDNLWVRYLPAVTEKNSIGVYIPEDVELKGLDSKVKIICIPSSNNEPLECTFKQLEFDQIPFKLEENTDSHNIGITHPLFFVSWDFINHFGIEWDGDLAWIVDHNKNNTEEK